MGSKVSILAFASEVPSVVLHADLVDQASASRELIESVLRERMEPVREVTLDEALWPLPGVACAGSFEGLELVTSLDLRQGKPSDMSSDVRRVGGDRNAFAVFMDSAIDWAAFAMWERGHLARSVSLSYEGGVVENEGVQLEFEQAFWALSTDVALGFHPLELGNEALRAFFGFVQEGRWDEHGVDPEEITLTEYRAQDAEDRQQFLREKSTRMIRLG